ncbi:MAG: hypothetical protein QGH74_00730 [Candidatus Brocadiia bacterium]|nr:hypothetical protein [Candidatus Brocadiia bacterium]
MARRLVILTVTVAFLTAAGGRVEPLYRMQTRHDLASAPVRGVTPGMVLATTALGAFRGIVVDIVWIRMEQLKQEGKFFEIVQLADLACRLSPNLGAVWDFNSWNMAYNVSVEIPDLNSRWPWVQKGIELLRDEGIPNNPTNPELYFSLARIYEHKIGQDLDDAHFHYKQELGLRMHEVLPLSDARPLLTVLSGIPTTSTEFLKSSSKLEEYHTALLEAGFDPFERAEDGAMRYFAYARNRSALPKPVLDLIEANRDAYSVIGFFARARRLEDLKLDSKQMLMLMKDYGPLDWRTPYAHAIYWADQGREQARAFRTRLMKERGIEGVDNHEWVKQVLNLQYGDIQHDRIIYSSLQKLVTNGRLTFDQRGVLMSRMAPDYRFTDRMIKQYEELLERYAESAENPGARWTIGIGDSYKFFLVKIISEFYFMGDIKKGGKYLDLLREKFPGYIVERYGKEGLAMVEVRQFVFDGLNERFEGMSPTAIRTLVASLLNRSYYFAARLMEQESSDCRALASEFAKRYNSTSNPTERNWIDVEVLRKLTLQDIFAGRAGFSPDLVQELYRLLPPQHRRDVDAFLQLEEGAATLRPGAGKVPGTKQEKGNDEGG